MLCGFERRACKQRGWEAGLKHRGWVRAFVFVLFGRAFRGSFFLVVLFVVRSSGSCFWFVLLVVLFVVRALGSCFWFVLLVRAFGVSYVFFLRCFKILRGMCGKVRGFLMQR